MSRTGVIALVALSLVACGGGGGSSSGGAGAGGVTPPPPPPPPPTLPSPTVSLTATPSSIPARGGSMLTWSSTDATSCTASGGWSGARATSGSEQTGELPTTTTYMLTCSNAAADVSASVTVSVVPPPTLEFSVTPNLVQRGSQVTVTWSTRNATSCRDPWSIVGTLEPAGTRTLTVDTQSSGLVWTMQCDGPGGTVQKTVQLAVQTLSGDLVIPMALSADADVNDPDAPYSSNDRLDQAMPVFEFGLVPGYLNEPLAGPPGRSYQAGDRHDFFRTGAMDAGQVVRLILPTVDMNQPAAARDDADLYLWDIDGRLIDAAIGSDSSEVLRIPTRDAYVIEVRSVHGGMNYLLSLEDPTSPAMLSAARLSADFVPGEAIVTLEPSTVSARGKSGGAAIAGDYRRKAGAVDREMRMALEPSALARYKPKNAGHTMSPRAADKLATLLGLKALRARSDVRDADLNRIVRAQATPSDPHYLRQQWHYGAIGLPLAWETTTGSSDVTVAVVDSGVIASHPDLQDKFVDGYDFVSDAAGLDGDGLDSDYSDPGYSLGGQWLFHGTHVAGTIGALANNGVGGAGVSWGARLMPLRAMDGRSGTSYDMLQAVRYAAGLSNDSGRVPLQRADIINLSISAPQECSSLEAQVFAQVGASGVTVVAAAGNFQSNVASSPASCPGVISVGAIGADGSMPFYSNYGNSVSLVAPGGNMDFDLDQDGFPDGVFSTSGTQENGVVVPGYAWLEGTSMAAPHVAGVLALMMSVKPTLSPPEIQQLLEGGFLTDDVGLPGRDDSGYGALNAVRALQAAGGVFPSVPYLGATPGALNFGNVEVSQLFRLRNVGSGLLTVHEVKSSVPWATVRPARIDSQGLGDYEVQVSRAGVPRGILNGTIDIASSAGSLVVPLVVTNRVFNVMPRLGRVYVRAIDAATGQTVRELSITDTSDRTAYRFDDVPPGPVIMMAGTDFNNDGNLCDAGEVCGAFPTGRLPDVVDYNGVRTSLDIPFGVTALSMTPSAISHGR